MTDIAKKNHAIQQRNKERGEIREEIKVVQIEEARERLKAKQEHSPAPLPQTQEERSTAFYRETYTRRAAMVKAFERENGTQEKELQREAARLTGSLENAGLVARIFRKVTGRTRADRDALDKVRAGLEDIGKRRDEQRAVFERERLYRLEALKAAQEREAQERARPMARVAGDPQHANTRAPEPLAQELMRSGEYENRRREYFRSLGARRKVEREGTQPPRDRKTREPRQPLP